jgi:hypothetical protein
VTLPTTGVLIKLIYFKGSQFSESKPSRVGRAEGNMKMEGLQNVMLIDKADRVDEIIAKARDTLILLIDSGKLRFEPSVLFMRIMWYHALSHTPRPHFTQGREN